MSTRLTQLKAFLENEQTLAAALDPVDLFSFWNRAHRVPAGQCALVIRTSGERVICNAGAELTDDDVAEVVWARVGAVPLTYADLTVHSIDHHACRAEVKLSATLIADAAELVGFRNRVMGSSSTADRSAVADYFRPHILAGLSSAADGRGVGALIDIENASTIAEEVYEAIKPVAFKAGIQVDPSITIHLDAPSYRQTQRTREHRRQRRAELSAKKHIEQARQAAETAQAADLQKRLAQLTRAADASPNESMMSLIRSFDAQERAQLYEALFATCDDTLVTDRIMVGAGDEILAFDPHSLNEPLQRVTVPGEVGPVRSIQATIDATGQHRLCIGASVGIYESASDLQAGFRAYGVEHDGGVRGGMNAVTLAGDSIYATHSELGLLAWSRGSDAPARKLLEGITNEARVVRCAHFEHNNIFFSADHAILRLTIGGEPEKPQPFVGSRSMITALCVTDRELYAGNADGEIIRWSLDDPSQPSILHNGRQRSCESIHMIEFAGIERLFYTDTSPAIFARIMGDEFISRFEAGGQTIRRVEVAADLIVGTNEARDRVFVWRPSQPASPAAVLPIARITGRSVQDVCLIPATA